MSKSLTLDMILSRSTNKKSLSTIKSLNLYGMNLEDISILADFPSLEIISLSLNNIKDLSVFRSLKNIKELYLKDNKISDLEEIENLRGNVGIEVLSLKNNPICGTLDYKKKVLEILPNLKKLDEINIKNSQETNESGMNIANGHNQNIKLNLISKKIQRIDKGKETSNKSELKSNTIVSEKKNEIQSCNNVLLQSFKKKKTQGNFRSIIKKQKLDFNLDDEKNQIFSDNKSVNETIDNLLWQSKNFNTLSAKKPSGTSSHYIKKIIGNFRHLEINNKTSENKDDGFLNGKESDIKGNTNRNVKDTLDVEIYDKDNIISSLKNIQKEKGKQIEVQENRHKILDGVKVILSGLNKEELVEIQNEVNKLLKRTDNN